MTKGLNIDIDIILDYLNEPHLIVGVLKSRPFLIVISEKKVIEVQFLALKM